MQVQKQKNVHQTKSFVILSRKLAFSPLFLDVFLLFGLKVRGFLIE